MLITPLTLLIRIFGVAILGRVQVRPGSHGSAWFAQRLPPDDVFPPDIIPAVAQHNHDRF
jgi:hypothetical protein